VISSVSQKKRYDFVRARILLQQKHNDKKKYLLVKWPDVCQPKDQVTKSGPEFLLQVLDHDISVFLM
jgi:hypothetical protein